MKYLRQHWLIILILALSLFVRLYRLPATMTFLEDEGRDLLMVKRMLDTKRPVLLGPQTSTGNMYLGPLYYYLITPALVLSEMDPIGPAIFIALTGVLTVYLLYHLGSKWFSRFAGTSASLMYAILPLPVFFTRNSWNPNLVPLISLLTIWIVSRLRCKSPRWWDYLLLGVLFGTLVQLHYMALIFIAAASLIVFVPLLKKWREFIRGATLSVIGFVLILSPFIFFEVRNDFVNTKALTRFVKAEDEQAIRYTLPAWLFRSKFELVSSRLLASQFGRGGQVQDPLSTPITYLSLLVFALGLYLAFRRRNNHQSRHYLILASLFFLPLLGLTIYQENIHLHYLGFFFPLCYLLLSGFSHFGKLARLVSLFLITLSLIYSLPITFNYLRSGETSQVIRAKEVADYIVNQAGASQYNVVSTEGYFTAPFQYYLALSDHPPTNSPASRVFVICEGAPCTKEEETTVLLFLTGPSHPSLLEYLGHPQLNEFTGKRTIISNEHASHGIWVAELEVEM